MIGVPNFDHYLTASLISHNYSIKIIYSEIVRNLTRNHTNIFWVKIP